MPGRPLAVVPVRDGVLPAGGAETIAEAGPDARVVLIGSQLGTAAGDLAGVATHVELAEVGDFAPGRWADALTPFALEASRVVLPGSPDGRDLATRLAAAADLPLVAGALEVRADVVTVVRHGGLVQCDVHPHGRFVATLQPGVRGVEPSSSETVITTSLDLVLGDGPEASIDEIEPPDAATMDLAEAPRIVGGGAGMLVGDDEAPVAGRFEQLTAIGAAVGASMGATRVVTDAGWVPHSRQIGTTGVVVDPELYLAFGVSGAVQHTAGLGHPDHVIAVNLDPHCPMMAMADLAVVAEVNATLDALAARLGVRSEAETEAESAAETEAESEAHEVEIDA